MEDRSVITISVGNLYFHHLASNLLESFLLWNSNNEIRFTLVTDNPDFFHKYSSDRIFIKKIDLPTKDKNFTSKFHLYKYTDFNANLFVDCDCLIYRDLSEVFNALNTFNFTAIGTPVTEGNFFCDVKKVIERWSIASLPTFVGSVYFFKKNQTAANIFDTAIRLKEKYDEYGFIRLRDQENEEPLFALAMALSNEQVYQGRLDIKCDAMFYQKLQTNVLNGQMNLVVMDQKTSSLYQNFDSKTAFIVHFNADFSDSWQYRLETYRLRQSKNYHFGKRLYAALFLKTLPLSMLIFKQSFRPLFRFIYGTRKIKTSKRAKHLETN